MDIVIAKRESISEELKKIRKMRSEARTAYKALWSKVEPAPVAEQKDFNKQLIKINTKLSAYIEALDVLMRTYMDFKEDDGMYEIECVKSILVAEMRAVEAHEALNIELDKQKEAREAMMR
jgi:hypothetical protein